MIVEERYPFGVQLRCTSCGCHVGKDHEPGSRDCQEAEVERAWSRSS